MVLTSIVALLRADMMDRYVNLWQFMYFIYFGGFNFLMQLPVKNMTYKTVK